jgi:cytoskeleton protein RodZ
MTLGQRLASVRESRGLELEKAAHDTRIRAQRLRELEADDYSHCPHPSYARMFLRDYAKYLGVPLADIKGDLPDSGECGAGGYQYLDELGGDDLPVPTVQRIKPRRRLLPALAGVTALLVIGFLSLQLVLTIRKIDSLGLDKPADSAEIKPAEASPETTVPTVAVAEDVAVLNETLSVTAEEAFPPVPATLATPASTPDGRAAFVVGSGLDAGTQVQ